MNAPLLDDEMRRALGPWDRHWTPPTGLLRINQFTTVQLLDAGSKFVVDWNNAETSFLQIVAHQEHRLSDRLRNWLDRLIAHYDAVKGVADE